MMFLNLGDVEELVSVYPIPANIENIVDYYRYFCLIVGLLIIVTNLSVVVTSGLILKKAVQPKSTYMLLGNISLADTFIGVAMILSIFVDKSIFMGIPLSKDPQHINILTVCMILQGMYIFPAVVSIQSIGFIAADRYVYLIHGLYYKTWVSSKRVRIAIVGTWITGIIFTIPGWFNLNNVTRCYFTDIFPIGQTLTMVALSFINIAIVVTLYTIILVKAVKANTKIEKAKKIAQIATIKIKSDKNIALNDSVQNGDKRDIYLVDKSTLHDVHLAVLDVESLVSVDSSIDKTKNYDIEGEAKLNTSVFPKNDMLTFTLNQTLTPQKIDDNPNYPALTLNRSVSSFIDVNKAQNKCKENKKCRAITVVILTTGCFLITWTPFLVSMVYYGYICEKINTKYYCEMSCQRVIRPVWAMALLNSLLNPFIYAWWHHGFKEYVRSCYKKCFRKVV